MVPVSDTVATDRRLAQTMDMMVALFPRMPTSAEIAPAATRRDIESWCRWFRRARQVRLLARWHARTDKGQHRLEFNAAFLAV